MIFEDGNCPGYIYFGDQDDWDWLVSEGGFPLLVNPSRVSSSGEVYDGERDEWVWPIQYPSKNRR